VRALRSRSLVIALLVTLPRIASAQPGAPKPADNSACSVPVPRIDLPEATLPYLQVARFSHHGRFLALAKGNRGAIWDLAANKRMVLTRSFRSA
jgi:hypothetical protein